MVLLCILINLSLQNGLVPDILKIAKILPLHKGKENNLLTNYRPVSLLPTVSRILEKVVHTRVYAFLNNNNLLYKINMASVRNTLQLMQSLNLLKIHC